MSKWRSGFNCIYIVLSTILSPIVPTLICPNSFKCHITPIKYIGPGRQIHPKERPSSLTFWRQRVRYYESAGRFDENHWTSRARPNNSLDGRETEWVRRRNDDRNTNEFDCRWRQDAKAKTVRRPRSTKSGNVVCRRAVTQEIPGTYHGYRCSSDCFCFLSPLLFQRRRKIVDLL